VLLYHVKVGRGTILLLFSLTTFQYIIVHEHTYDNNIRTFVKTKAYMIMFQWAMYDILYSHRRTDEQRYCFISKNSKHM